jgi:hypothetical protein
MQVFEVKARLKVPGFVSGLPAGIASAPHDIKPLQRLNNSCARHPVINEHVVMHKDQTGAARRLVACSNMQAHPVRECLLTQLSGRQFEHLDDTVSIVRLEVPPIELEEQLDRNECSALVAVNKGVIAGEAVAIRGG